MTIGTKNLLFTGDYSENSVVYTCDLIRNISADCAIIDCAYGNEEFSVPDAIQKFTALFCQIQSTQQNLLLPVPKYGRGVDLLYIIKKLYPSMKVYGDACISEQVSKKMETWYLQYSKNHIEKIENWRKGPAVLIITDPQLRENRNQMLAENIFESGGIILHTGHIYENTYADVLLKEGNAKQIIYPVHMNYGAASMLVAANHFSKVILNHSKDTVTDYTNLTKGYINRDVIMI